MCISNLNCNCGCNRCNQSYTCCEDKEYTEDGCLNDPLPLKCSNYSGEDIICGDLSITLADTGDEVIKKLADQICLLQEEGLQDKFVKISETDSTSSYLKNKIQGSTYIGITPLNPNLNEVLRVDLKTNDLVTYILTQIPIDKYLRISSTDTTSGYLGDKLIGGNGINITKGAASANENLSLSVSISPTTGNQLRFDADGKLLAPAIGNFFPDLGIRDRDSINTKGWFQLLKTDTGNPFYGQGSTGSGASGIASFEGVNNGWVLMGQDGINTVTGQTFDLYGALKNPAGGYYSPVKILHSGNLASGNNINFSVDTEGRTVINSSIPNPENILASNGLTKRGSTIELGGALIRPTVIEQDRLTLTFNGISSDSNIIVNNNSNGAGLISNSVSNTGVVANSMTGYGLDGNSIDSIGVHGSSLNSIAGLFSVAKGEGISVPSVLAVLRDTTTTSIPVSSGIGTAIEFQIKNTDAIRATNRLVSRLTTVGNNSYTSQFEIETVTSGQALTRKLALTGAGKLVLDSYNTPNSFTPVGDPVGYLSVEGDGSVGVVSDSLQLLTPSPNVVWDFRLGREAKIVLNQNISLSINFVKVVSYGTISIQQDAVGGRTITLPAGSRVGRNGNGAITLTSTPNAIDVLTFRYDGTNFFWKKEPNYT